MLERLGSELTPAALEAAARHPGVGVEVVERLGAAGVQASKRYDTDAVIQLVKSSEAKSFTALPASEKTGLLKRVAQFIEQHPKTVLGAAGLALFVRYKDELLGDKGEIITGPDGTPIYVPKTGILERSSNRILEWLLPIAAAIVALSGANRLFWAWRWSKVSYAVKRRDWRRRSSPNQTRCSGAVVDGSAYSSQAGIASNIAAVPTSTRYSESPLNMESDGPPLARGEGVARLLNVRRVTSPCSEAEQVKRVSL